MNQGSTFGLFKGPIRVEGTSTELAYGADPTDPGTGVALGAGAAVENRSQPFLRVFHLQEILQAQPEQLKLFSIDTLDRLAIIGPRNHLTLLSLRAFDQA